MDHTEIIPIESLEILFEDPYLIAVNKPHGLLVHPTKLARNVNQFAVDILKEQLGYAVFPVHRLDRKTSGVLLFSKDRITSNEMRELFVEKQITKEYLAIVRGYFPSEVSLNHDLTNDKGKTQEAITDFICLEHTEIELAHMGHSTSRYSLIKAFPQTGRMHQIRKHCQHLRHPIIGDRPHGCSKQNRLFKSKWNMVRTMLHANSMQFKHPRTEEDVLINAECSDEFKRMVSVLEFDYFKQKKADKN